MDPYLSDIKSIYHFYKELDMRDLKEELVKGLKIVESDY